MTVMVWVLVFSSYINGGGATQVSGDYATAQDCERVAKVIRDQPRYGAQAQCVQVNKIVRER